MLLIVAGCGSPPQAVIGAGDFTESEVEAKGATVVDVYVATSRAADDDPSILFSGERSSAVSFTRVPVSIPPNHQPGQIERPRRNVPNPRTEFAILQPTPLPSPHQFIASLNSELARRSRDERDVLIFVHGYNTDLTSAIFRIVQFTNDIDYPGVPVLFSWASRGRTFDYVYDINSALHARDALLETGEILSRSKADGFNILAHSMGTLLTVEAMRQSVLMSGGDRPERFRIKNIALAAPDIDLDLFRRQLEVVPTTDIPIYVLISDDDRALGLSSFLAGGESRVGIADLEDLTDLGLIVIDLSAVEDRDTTSHTKFANSPEVIKVLGKGLRTGNTLETRNGGGFRLADIASAPDGVIESGRALIFE
ncbi:MAG: alpha/beta hydrolase [Pseudomonadota bacterium]